MNLTQEQYNDRREMIRVMTKSPLILKVKRLSDNAVLPKKSYQSDAGFDVVATSEGEVHEHYIEYHTDLKFEIPKGFHIEMRSRSSISKTSLILATGTSTIDQGFSGELIIRFKIIPTFTLVGFGHTRGLDLNPPIIYHKGDRIAQLILQRDENVVIQEIDELHMTDRAENGLGSTGK